MKEQGKHGRQMCAVVQGKVLLMHEAAERDARQGHVILKTPTFSRNVWMHAHRCLSVTEDH